MDRIYAGAVAALVALGAVNVAAIEPPSPSSGNTVVLPDLTFQATPSDVDHYWRYYYIHKPGISFATARSDFLECNAYSASIQMQRDPDFVPYGGDAPPNTFDIGDAAFAQWGLVGVLIVGIANDDVNLETERENMRVCVTYKGYTRYGTTKAIWNSLYKGTNDEIATRLATIASGPTPPGERLDQ
jgi:hypothetical protein